MSIGNATAAAAIGDATTKVTEASKPFLDQVWDENLLVVIVGGLVGGLIQPAFSRMMGDQPNPPGWAFLWNPLLGVAAAGISVYVIADSQHTDAMRLLFFSVLCGLAFPSVLERAMNTLGRQSNAVKTEVANIENQSKDADPEKKVDAAQKLTVTLSRNPITAVASNAVPIIDTSATSVVTNLADAYAVKPDTLGQIVNQLHQVGTAAKTSGYTGTTLAAASQLNKIGDAQPAGAPLREIAHGAASKLLGS